MASERNRNRALPVGDTASASAAALTLPVAPKASNELLIGDDLAEGRPVEIGASDVRIGTYDLAMRSDAVGEAPMRALVEWLDRVLRLTRRMQKTNGSRAK
jgi:hypothetical protein